MSVCAIPIVLTGIILKCEVKWLNILVVTVKIPRPGTRLLPVCNRLEELGTLSGNLCNRPVQSERCECSCWRSNPLLSRGFAPSKCILRREDYRAPYAADKSSPLNLNDVMLPRLTSWLIKDCPSEAQSHCPCRPRRSQRIRLGMRIQSF